MLVRILGSSSISMYLNSRGYGYKCVFDSPQRGCQMSQLHLKIELQRYKRSEYTSQPFLFLFMGEMSDSRLDSNIAVCECVTTNLISKIKTEYFLCYILPLPLNSPIDFIQFRECSTHTLTEYNVNLRDLYGCHLNKLIESWFQTLIELLPQTHGMAHILGHENILCLLIQGCKIILLEIHITQGCQN